MQPTGGATITGSASISTGNPWHIVGAADFNADGHRDLVWQSPALAVPSRTSRAQAPESSHFA